eukprot:Rhum_TRINITY_DN6313_c0_g2::Rhum_TRINITY_DN6313_c0_g2_i1::g.19716::m.19716
MRWVALSFTSLDDVVQQTDEVATILRALASQAASGGGGTTAPEVLGGLLASCKTRIAELEAFYSANDLHASAFVVEQQRVKLKRAVVDADAQLQQQQQQQQQQAPAGGGGGGGGPTATLRVRLTASEFQELQRRRAEARHVRDRGGYSAPSHPSLSTSSQSPLAL